MLCAIGEQRLYGLYHRQHHQRFVQCLRPGHAGQHHSADSQRGLGRSMARLSDGIGLSQTIPAETPAGAYTLNMTLTATAS